MSVIPMPLPERPKRYKIIRKMHSKGRPSLNPEVCFNDFLERREYDAAANALLSMVRTSFLAGWYSAGGHPPPPHTVLRLVRKDLTDLPDEIPLEPDF